MNILLVAYIALCFGAWPLMARYAALPGSWTNMFVGFATFAATVVPVLFTKDKLATQNLKFSLPLMVGLVLLGGAINGNGLVNFGKLYLGSNAAADLAGTFVLMIVVTTLGSRLFFGDQLNAWKIAGVFSAFVTIWLLNHR